MLLCALLGASLFYLSTGLGEDLGLRVGRVLACAVVRLRVPNQLACRRSRFPRLHLRKRGLPCCFRRSEDCAVDDITSDRRLRANVASLLFRRFVYNKLGALWALAAFPACWTALEYLTSLASPNGTVGALAYTQVGAPILIQSAALFGFSSVTFRLCLTANGVALALSSRRQAPALVVIVASAFALNLGWGALRLHEALGASVRVAAAAKDQSDTQLVRDETYWRAVTEAYAAGARRLAQAGASTIVLPEKLATLTPEWRGPVLAPLATAAREARVRIVAGFDDEDTNHNRAIVFDPDGTVSTYDKRRLVVGLEVARPGDHAGWLGGGLGVAICKDMDFPQMIRNDARSGIRLMLVPAEDFYVDRWMHARIAIMRGVENGFAVVRAARKGDVTISDDRGRLLARAASSTAFAN